MIPRLPGGVFAAAIVVLVASCSQGTSGSAGTSNPAPTASSTTAPSTAPSAAPSASAATGSGKTVAVAEVNATNMGGAFSPAMLEIHVGDTVQWTNSSGNIHNVTFADATMHSPIMYAGDKWSQVFTKPGTYKYTCTFHPGMDGTIVVT